MLIIRWNASNNSGLHCGWTEIIEERTVEATQWTREGTRSRRVGEKKTAGSPFVFAVIVADPVRNIHTLCYRCVYTCKRVPTNSFRSHARSTKYARSNLDESQNSKKQQHAYMTVYIYNVYMCIQSGVSIQYRVNLKNKILKKISRIKGF